MLDAMARHKPVEIPPDLRTRLETARLDLLALFRALDRMYLTPEHIPQRLIRQLFELDADYVEALWGLDQPPGKLNLQLMLRDTLAASINCPPPVPGCGKTSLLKRYPHFLNLNARSAPISIPLRPTTWFPTGPPKSFKHPSDVNF